MTQSDLFTAPTAESERRKGLERVTAAKADFIAAARAVALTVARRDGFVTADSLREECGRRGIGPGQHYNAWGAVFSRHPGLRWSGEFRVSKLPQGHQNLQRVWVVR